MQEKFLKQAFEFVVGGQAENLVNILSSDKFVNEFLIAKKLGIEINQARNLLYKLSDNGLVEFTRKKDKKKGWYTYFWGIEVLKSLEYVRTTFEKRIDQINHQVKSRESKVFYICENCNVEYTEENALQHDFTCPECGNIFVLKDNSKVVRELKKNLERYEKDLELLKAEIGKVRKLDENKRVKNAKKEKNIAKKKRDQKREAKKFEAKANEKHSKKEKKTIKPIKKKNRIVKIKKKVVKKTSKNIKKKTKKR